MKNLLILHGAIGAVKQFTHYVKFLESDYKVYAIDFTGHGGSDIPSIPFSIKLFGNDVLKWMEQKNFETIDIFGYSMGGYVALYLARHYPEKIGKIFTLATKFHWHEETAKREAAMLNPDIIMEKFPAYAEELKHRHSPEDWKVVLQKTADMMIELGHNNTLKDEDYRAIEAEVLVSVGDRDKMVSIDETLGVYKQLKNGQMLVMPNTPHPIEKVDPDRLVHSIKEFFK
jgi:pimeloyl-ACP methyl ester carboxylesterase